MKILQRLITAATLVGVLSGCAASINIGAAGDTGPACLAPLHGRPKELNGTLVLAAQAVPTATQVPCLRRLPVGWTFHSFSARSGQARISLDLGHANDTALVVTLTRDCDVRSAVRLKSDRAGAQRFDQIQRTQRYSGERYYLFPGGCTTFRFNIHGAGAAEAARTVVQSVGAVDRPALRRYVRAYSRGRFDLDPAPGS